MVAARYAAVAGSAVRIAGAGAYAVSYRVCGQRVPRLENLELTATRR